MIALAAIMRDEAENLERCLNAAAKVVEKVVLVDTGSEDDSIAVARSWSDESGVPLILYEESWQNFKVNRTSLIRHAEKEADWMLLLDIDLVVHAPNPLVLEGSDCWQGRVRFASLDYTLPFLIRSGKPWYYEGVAHSYLACDEEFDDAEMEGLWVEDYSHTGPEKLERDLEALSAEHARNPLDRRTVFYLAQTHYDLDHFEEAIAYYRMRAEMGGWDEEVYFSRYRLGCLLSEHVSFAAGAKELLRAWEERPERIEALRALAGSATSVANKIPRTTDRLFVGKASYDPHEISARARPSRPVRAEVEEIFFHRYTPRAGGVIVELGAAEGTETPLLSRLVGPTGTVIAVEAHPTTFRQLQTACDGLANIRLLYCAVVAERREIATISDDPVPWHNRLIDGSGIEVPAATLDAITRDLDRIDLLKVNVEGVEADVLAASPQTLAKTSNVVVSCHDFVGVPTKARAREALEAAGFAVGVHDDPHVIEDGHNGRCLGDYLYAQREATIEEPVVASLASIPERTESLERTVASLLPQVDLLRVYLNGYEEVPDFLDDPKVEVARCGDLGDGGKFYWLEDGPDGYRLTCDDDLEYPADYAASMVAAVEEYGRRALVGLHGRRLAENGVQEDGFYCLEDVARDEFVNVLGTGVLAYHTSTLPAGAPPTLRNMADQWLAAWAQANEIPCVVRAHRGDWLKHTDYDLDIWGESQRRTGSTMDVGARREEFVRSIRWRLFEFEPKDVAA